MTAYDDLMETLRGMHDLSIWDIPPPEDGEIIVPPVVQISSSGTKYIFMPTWTHGSMWIEVWGFQDGAEMLHDFLQFDN